MLRSYRELIEVHDTKKHELLRWLCPFKTTARPFTGK